MRLISKKQIMIHLYFKALLVSLFFFCVQFDGLTQTVQQEKMAQLDYMIGEWVGKSKGYEDGALVREEPAFERISYDLDSSIIVLELHSESLQLHTIIYYDETDATYYYHPFSKTGNGRAPATFENGQLVVHSSETRRYFFCKTANRGFREYGQRLSNGTWTTYFQDDFVNTK